MEVLEICREYFNGFNDLSNIQTNTRRENTSVFFRIFSYFTVIIPLCFGITYGVLEWHRFRDNSNNRSPDQGGIDHRTSEVFNTRFPQLVTDDTIPSVKHKSNIDNEERIDNPSSKDLTPFLERISNDCLAHVFLYLPLNDLFSNCLVAKNWEKIGKKL